jgi:hypothetical protein
LKKLEKNLKLFIFCKKGLVIFSFPQTWQMSFRPQQVHRQHTGFSVLDLCMEDEKAQAGHLNIAPQLHLIADSVLQAGELGKSY